MTECVVGGCPQALAVLRSLVLRERWPLPPSARKALGLGDKTSGKGRREKRRNTHAATSVAVPDNGSDEAPETEPLPAEFAADLRRFLAEALVADYLAANAGDRRDNGDVPLADANPSGRGPHAR